MQALQVRGWHRLPEIVSPSPVMALVATSEGLWAAGTGGVAWRPPGGGDWKPKVSGLPLTSVAALAHAGGQLFAGGAEGIARSSDGGDTWEMVTIEESAAVGVSALIASPRFDQDHTAIAATLEAGVLRTDDGGATWRAANFGLQEFEVTSLAWTRGENVVAGTPSGIVRSPNAGRAWRSTTGSEGAVVAALAALDESTVFAAIETGGMLRSNDGGATWSPLEGLPEDVQGTTLFATPEGALLLGAVERGILRSEDRGETWQHVHEQVPLSFGVGEGRVYAGTVEGVLESPDDGRTWQQMPTPPVHDLRRLLAYDGGWLVLGTHSPPARFREGGGWETLESAPLPLLTMAAAPDGSLYASCSGGLMRSTDSGRSWEQALAGEDGQVGRLTFRSDGAGWGGSHDGSRLIRTRDGRTWERIESPFGVLPLAALQAFPDSLIAATYDVRQQTAVLWRSKDDGDNWERVFEVQVYWPVVATLPQPPIFTLSGTVFLADPAGRWTQKPVGTDGGVVRRIAAWKHDLIALTTTSVWRSSDEGTSWAKADEGLPMDQVMDVEVSGDRLYVLLAGGEVWWRSL